MSDTPMNITAQKRSMSVKKLVTMAVLCAISYLAMVLVKFPIVPAVGFLTYEPKDVILAIGSFIFGPLSALAMSVVVSLVEMVTVSGTGPIGMLMNVISTCAYICTASFVYKKKNTLSGAVVGLILGSILATGLMLLWNYIITPMYLGVAREDIVKLLVPGFLPFNLIKTGLNTALTLLLYKPVITALRRAQLVQAGGGGEKARINWGVFILAAFILITCALIILILRGII
jgi:riboflavin transporter FmnP